MIRIEKILVPLDLSELSERALLYAQELASAYGARIELLHVIDHWGLGVQGGIGIYPDVGVNVTESLRGNCESALAKCRESMEWGDVQTTVVIGSPHVEIIQLAREKEVDVIVMATHGRGGLNHVLIGSVAEKVVQMASCPVLTIRHPEHEFVMP